MERKIEAFQNATRAKRRSSSCLKATPRRHGTVERFHLAASVKPQDAQIEDDLFAGVEDDG